jgi:glycosyltransferase involved in cell wall biosynthesis
MKSCPVTAIIPCFNRAQYIARAIHSVLEQTLPCQAIIVVDDGSTDNSLAVIKRLAKESIHTPISIIRQENLGPAAARNTGIRASQTPLVAFLDSDDHWHKSKIFTQYTRMLSEDSYLISHTREKWLRRGKHLNQKKKHEPRHGDIFSQCLQLCAVGMSTVMASKELFCTVGFFDETLPCCEDYDLWLRVSCRLPFLLVDHPLTVKEGGREDQVSHIYRVGMDRYRIQSLEKLLLHERLRDDQYALAVAELERKIHIFATGCRKHGKAEVGQQYLDKIAAFR